MDIGNSTDSKMLLDRCRICVSKCDELCCIYEQTDHESSLSVHSMLEKLFPAIFNLEQVKHDRSMNWPATICRDCRWKVIHACALYETCEKSVVLLNQYQFTMISDGVPIASDEEYFSSKPLEGVPLDTEEVFNLPLVKQDDSIYWPAPVSQDNKSKMINAYVLHARREKSVDLSDQQQLKTISEGVPVAKNEEYFTNEPSEEVPPPHELHSHVKLIVRVPQTVRASKRISSRQRGNVIRNVTKTKRKPTKAKEVKCSEEHEDFKEKSYRKRSRQQSDEGNLSEEKSKENFHLQLVGPKASRKTSPKVERTKLKGGGSLETKIDSPHTTHADTEELETKIDLYNCLLCEAPTYSSPKELTDHLNENHPEQILLCEHCPKVFVTQTSFEQHQYCHATGRSYFCTFCDKGFQTEKLLKNHIRTHTHRLDYLCSHCGKEFNNKGNLRQHIIGHSGSKPWACNLCPCRFSTKGGLTIHQNTHTKVKMFSCDICGSQFNKHYSLIKHKLIHTGERPFGCEVCDMRFATSYMVKRHMRTHTGEKPFKCTYCERSFSQSNDMVKHMKIHVGSNPYQCDRCDVSFRLLTDLRNHYKDHYQAGELGPGSSLEQDAGIRFTSINILQLRYKKEKGIVGNER